MLHQRLERIHIAINGQPKKLSDAKDGFGLMAIVPEDDQPKLKTLMEKVEKVQSDLNDEKNADLAKLKSSVRASIADLLTACEAFTGADKEAKVEETDDEVEETFSGN